MWELDELDRGVGGDFDAEVDEEEGVVVRTRGVFGGAEVGVDEDAGGFGGDEGVG